MDGRRHAAALLAVSLAYALVILDATAVNVALPSLGRDLGGGIAELQWVVAAYTLTLASLLLSGGALCDRFGARRLLEIGVATFAAASLACGAAPSVGALIAARTLQGAGAGLALPASLALLGVAFTEPAQRARAIGVWGGVAGVAAAAGPPVGGALVALAGWRAIFLVNVPVAAFALALGRRVLPSPPGRPEAALDPLGQLLAAAALAALAFGLIEAGAGAAAGEVAAALAAALLLAAAFLAHERRTPAPLLPGELLRRNGLAAGVGIGLLINLGFYGQLFVVSVWLQEAEGASPLATGVRLLPELAMASIGSVLSGRLTARASSPWPAARLGLATGAAGLLGLALAAPHGYAWIVAPLVATGLGMSLTMPAATAAVVEAAGESAGVASGLLNAGRQAGGVLGVALLGTLLARGGPTGGLRAALLAGGAAFLVGLLLTQARPQRSAPSR
jgi:DHA2 family methylenomycin A resistance protein-like MFS transporter